MRRFGSAVSLTSLVLLSLLVGCERNQSRPVPPTATSLAPISIAVIDDASLAEVMSRELTAQSDRPIEVEVVSLDQLLAQPRLQHDLLFYSPALMGELIAREWIVPLPSAAMEQPQLELDDIPSALRQVEMRWGSQTYALPLGSPVLVLMFRADALAQLDLEPPRTWQQYADAVTHISRSDLLQGEQAPFRAATLEPLAPEFLPQLWLARSAAYVRHGSNLSTYFDYSSGEARVATAGFVRAAQQLAATAQTIPSDLRQLSPTQAAQHFLAGDAVMTIGWITPGTEMPTQLPGDIQFAPLPGSAEFFDATKDRWTTRPGQSVVSVPLISASGMVGSITAASGQTLAAADVLISVASAELAPLISPASDRTTLFRTSNLPQAQTWLPDPLTGPPLRQYAQVTIEQLQSTQTLATLRTPHRDAFLQAAREALLKVLENPTADAPSELQNLAQTWDQLSQQHGRATHIKAFRNSQAIGDTAF